MAKRKSPDIDEWQVPDESASMQEKLEHQRKLRAAWDACAEHPFDAINIPLEDASRWWTHPTNPSPEQIERQIQKQMRKYLSE
jgi:hypothetical protein